MRKMVFLALALAAAASAQKSGDECRAEVGDRGVDTQRAVMDCLISGPYSDARP